MNLSNIKYVAVVLVVFVLSSCQDLLTKELPLEDVGYEPQMVLNSIVANSRKEVLISITKNISLAQVEPATYDFVNDADVVLRINGQVYEVEPVPLDLFNFAFFNEGNVDLVGATIEIEASHGTYPSISATTTVPEAAMIKDISYELDGGTVPFETESWNSLDLTIEDEVNVANYYAIELPNLTVTDTIINGLDTFIFQNLNGFDIYTTDPNLERVADRIYISDKAFDGLDYRVKITNQPFSGEVDVDQLEFIFSHVSEEEYLYQTSLQRTRNAANVGFFSEPTTLFSNVEGGLGVFRSYHEEYYKVR